LKKKQEEKDQMKNMIKAGEYLKTRKEQEWKREKDEDIAIQQAYIEILEKQERDRIEEYQRRERRQKEN
jgi:hypothetical protein